MQKSKGAIIFFILTLKNSYGDSVDMTTTVYDFKDRELNPPPGTLSTPYYAGMDGNYLKNISIEQRNVVIQFEMCSVNIETQ